MCRTSGTNTWTHVLSRWWLIVRRAAVHRIRTLKRSRLPSATLHSLYTLRTLTSWCPSSLSRIAWVHTVQ